MPTADTNITYYGSCTLGISMSPAGKRPAMRMEIINRAHLDLFLDIVVATRHHVDVLLVLWLHLVKSFDDEKLQGMTKVLLT